jgi:hypothetical protein
MKTRYINISRLMEFMRCPRAYFENIMKARERDNTKQPLTEPQVLGDVTHMLTAGEEPAAAREFIREEMPHEPEAKQEEVLAEAVELADKATKMSAPEVTNERREVQLMWHDPETGYNIYAKPDELFFFDEERNGRQISVMQITDVKSQAEEAKSYHWRQVYLFGLVATMALKYYHAIKLVVRLAATETEYTRWYSQQETWRQLNRLRETLREIDIAWATRTFEEKPGGYCRNCPLVAEGRCAIGADYLRRLEEDRLAMQGDDEDGEGDGDRVPVRLPVIRADNQACA